MNLKSLNLILTAALLWLCDHTLIAKEDILTPDMWTRAAAGTGLHLSRGVSSIFHNPANIYEDDTHHLYGEINFSFVDYKYQPASKDKSANLKLFVPPVFLGGSYHLPYNLQLAGGINPRGTGRFNKIENLPLLVEGQLVNVTAVQRDTSFRAVLGAALKINSNVKLGIAYLRDFDHEEFFLYGDSDEPTLTIDNHGQFSRILLGSTFQVSQEFSVAFAYHSVLEKPYQGQTQLINGLASQETTAYHFFPEEIRLGSKLDLGTFSLFGDYNFRRYSQGRTKRRVGVGAFDGKERDLHDTHNLSLAASKDLGEKTYITGIGFQNSPVNAGFVNADGETDIAGIQMNADFDYLNRITIAGGVFRPWNTAKLGLYTSYMYGWKNTPDHAPNSGNYRIHVFYFGIGNDLTL